MILLLDIGNSRLKSARLRGARLQPGLARAHHGAPERLVARLPRNGVRAVWIAQVLGARAERALAQAVRRRFGVRASFARVQRECLGLRIAYRDPRRLGVDRWLTMLALWSDTGQAFCVASAGTALTFDAVDGDGRHAGGLIASGLHTAERAVLGATRFRHLNHNAPYRSGLGRDTETCVRQGALHACAGLLDRAARAAPGRRYLGGGDARQLRPHLQGRWIVRPHLVLEGLRTLARHA